MPRVAPGGSETHVGEGSSALEARAADRPSRPWLPDLLGIGWVLAAAAAVMGPSLVHGLSLGPFDLLSQHGLTAQRGVVVHNPKTSDQIQLFIPWTALAWTQVHQGHLPLWNPYSVLGMPLAFNWESAPFGLPALVGYLVPLRYAYTVGVLVTLIIAGTGVYVLGRVMNLGVLGCAMAATVYELSGRFMVTLGWSLGSVMSWAGWLFAFSILIVRGRHRLRDTTLLAVTLALMVYAGYPEGVVLLVVALMVFLVVLLGMRAHRLGGSGAALGPIRDIMIAGIAGAALSAPLLLPGLQVAAKSKRNGQLGAGIQTLSPRYFVNFIVQGFDGLPWHGSSYFGPHTAGSTLIYLGVIAVVMAMVAVGVRWRRPEVLAFAVAAVVTTALVFVTPLASLIDHLPNVGSVRLYDGLGPAALATAVLSGVGIDILVRSHDKRVVQYWAGASFAVVALLLLTLWAAGRGHLSPQDAAIRAQSFVWPFIEAMLGLSVIALLALLRRRDSPALTASPWLSAGRWAALFLLTLETASLIAAGAPVFSSNSAYLTATPAVTALNEAVGSSIVGFGSPCGKSETLGVIPNVNVAFQIQEFGVYDPIVPYAYLQSWGKATGKPTTHVPGDTFCPAVTKANVARLFGIEYVLEGRGQPGPRGSSFDKRVGNEDLYRIPGAAKATLSRITPKGKFPGPNAPGTPVSVKQPDPASWIVHTFSTSTEVLRLRLTDVPGWHATIDGRPLQLDSFDRVMLQARVPPGHHTIQLNYRPATFIAGIVLAIATVLAFIVIALVLLRRRRTVRLQPAAPKPSDTALTRTR